MESEETSIVEKLAHFFDEIIFRNYDENFYLTEHFKDLVVKEKCQNDNNPMTSYINEQAKKTYYHWKNIFFDQADRITQNEAYLFVMYKEYYWVDNIDDFDIMKYIPFREREWDYWDNKYIYIFNCCASMMAEIFVDLVLRYKLFKFLDEEEKEIDAEDGKIDDEDGEIDDEEIDSEEQKEKLKLMRKKFEDEMKSIYEKREEKKRVRKEKKLEEEKKQNEFSSLPPLPSSIAVPPLLSSLSPLPFSVGVPLPSTDVPLLPL
jgi:hypothetical protein